MSTGTRTTARDPEPSREAQARDRAANRRIERVLLLGSSGRLGGAIAAALRAPGMAPGLVLHAPSRAELALDPTYPGPALAHCLGAFVPTVVVNCIAASDVDACERDPAHAHALNTALPSELARATRAHGARLVHFSTDYVFDGTLRRPCREDDAARPLSAYGASKLAGEQAIAAAGARHWIFRVSWLYGAPRANLAARLLDPDHAGCTLGLDNDRVGVPNPVQLIAHEVAHCIATQAEDGDTPEDGLYHLSCRGATTWYAFGRAFLREAVRAGRLAPARLPRLQPLVEPITEPLTGSAAGPLTEPAADARPARRPAWSPLDPQRYERCFGRSMPRWESAIRWAMS